MLDLVASPTAGSESFVGCGDKSGHGTKLSAASLDEEVLR